MRRLVWIALVVPLALGIAAPRAEAQPRRAPTAEAAPAADRREQIKRRIRSMRAFTQAEAVPPRIPTTTTSSPTRRRRRHGHAVRPPFLRAAVLRALPATQSLGAPAIRAPGPAAEATGRRGLTAKLGPRMSYARSA